MAISDKLKRYLIVGASAYLIEMLSLYGLRSGVGLSPLKAIAISFWVGFTVAFILQKLVTFQNYDKRAKVVANQLVRYGLLVAWNYGFTLLVVRLFSHFVSVFIIRTVVILIITSWNFIIYKSLFKEPVKE